MKKPVFLLFMLFFLTLFVFPAYAAEEGGVTSSIDLSSIGLGLAAACCGIAQSRALGAGCEAVARNPGAADTVRFFTILGLAFIEFLALLTFVYVAFF